MPLAGRAPDAAWAWGPAACVAIAAVAWAHVIWWAPVDKPLHSELHLDVLQLVCSDAYVIAGLACLLFAWAPARRCTALAAARPAPLGSNAQLAGSAQLGAPSGPLGSQLR